MPNIIPLVRQPLYRFLTITNAYCHSLRAPRTSLGFIRPASSARISSGSLESIIKANRLGLSKNTGYGKSNLAGRRSEVLQKIHTGVNQRDYFMSVPAISLAARENAINFVTSCYMMPEVPAFDLRRASKPDTMEWILSVLMGNRLLEETALSMASRWEGTGNDLVEADKQTLYAYFGDEYVAAIINTAKLEFID